MRTHRQTVHTQFDPRATAYLDSSVHASGAGLQFAETLVGTLPEQAERALDVGCGAGHLSFRLAPHVRRMIALDPSPNMLATVARTAEKRGLNQIDSCTASAESLPFADGSFALVCTRYSAHHWFDLAGALGEMRRVLAPGGHVLIIDALGADTALADTHLQTIELLRDASHVRDRTAREWRALLTDTGFTVQREMQWQVRLEFSSWVARMGTPQARVTAIRSVQDGAPSEVRAQLAIDADGSFSIQTGLFWCSKSA